MKLKLLSRLFKGLKINVFQGFKVAWKHCIKKKKIKLYSVCLTVQGDKLFKGDSQSAQMLPVFHVGFRGHGTLTFGHLIMHDGHPIEAFPLPPF